MAAVICEVSEGLRASEASVKVPGVERPEFLPVPRDFLTREGNKYYLPVRILHRDEQKKVALVALPQEADSGANRMWVRFADLHNHNETAHGTVRP
jgi:hypothetical protein